MIRGLLISAAVLALAAPAGAAFAHEDDVGAWYRHEQDHQEHGGFHDEVDVAHEYAHEQGFRSRAEHDGYHRALRDTHDEFHADHPGTRHDGYRLPSRRSGYSSYGYAPAYGYGYAPEYSPYGYGSGVTLSFGGIFGR